MFGEMRTESLLRFRASLSLDAAVGALLKLAESPEIAGWVQFPSALLVFLVVPKDPASGAFYVFNRRTRTWIWVDFKDQAYGGYTLADFRCLLRDCRFLRLVERPSLLRRSHRRLIQPGMAPERLVCQEKLFDVSTDQTHVTGRWMERRTLCPWR